MKHRNRKEHAGLSVKNMERLKEVWFQDATYDALAERLGITRTSVAGYYHRNPELRETHPISFRCNPNAKRDDTTKRNFSQRAARIEAIQTVRKQQSEYTGPRGLYTLITLPHVGCKWPYGSEPAEMTFCGHERRQGEPYCTAHARLAYTPRAEIQKRKRDAGAR